MRAKFLSSLPHDVLDNLLAKMTPKTPPADLDGKFWSVFLGIDCMGYENIFYSKLKFCFFTGSKGFKFQF